MQLAQLYNFMEVVKYHSISVAAERNFISQSSFSSSISRLEKELGVSLLKRTNTGITVTEYGRFVYEEAEKIFAAHDNIIEASGSDRFSGRISVSSIPGANNRLLPEAIQKVHCWNENIIISVYTGESRDVALNVSNGDSSLGIVVCGPYLKSFKNIRYTPLFQDEYHLYAGQSSPLWNKTSVTMNEIKDQSYIAYQNEFQKDNGGLTELISKKYHPAISLNSDDPDFIKRIISCSDHVAFFPKYMAENDFYLEKGLIKSLPVSDYDLVFEVGYIENTTYRLSLQDKKVIEMIKSTVEEMFERKNNHGG